MSEKFDWKKLLLSLPYKEILGGAYKALRPSIAKKVASSEKKWDDAVFAALDQVVSQLLELDLSSEKARQLLVEEAK